MPAKRKRKKSRKKRHHIILILLLIAAGIFLFNEEFGKEDSPRGFFDIPEPAKKAEIKWPEMRPSATLPMVAIVMDDLGPNRKLAEIVLSIRSPLTLSILPQQRYSKWIAEEGKRLGRDIIVHLPMEAARPLKLGEGGLYTWMADNEIKRVVEEDIRSVPYITGASNHMGSAFTRDSRTMQVLMSVLNEHGLFFLDSRTTPDSVGFRLAKEEGLKTLRRDIFLDDTNNPREIEIQWNKLIQVAKKKGRAIALAHPKKNTLEFLRNVLKDNKEIIVVPISDLIVK